ncbi:MAG: hypothetical protein ACFE89_05180 [Candidatus Hodarchaeota archaeon]
MLVLGGALLLASGQSLVLDPIAISQLSTLLNTVLGSGIGDILITIMVIATSLGGVCAIIGGIIWYAAGTGIGALVGRIIVGVASFAATYFLVMQILSAVNLGLFAQPLHVILGHFFGMGVSFTSVLLIVLGDLVGAGRQKEYQPSPAAHL